MEKYLCIHGHFYQPPRENPWLEAIEIQDSAHPYHDWNERITAECYAPNSAARVLDGAERIIDIVSNYSRISFNFGPTLLTWMETTTPEVYHAILEADKLSREWRSGHGNAIAQAYSHLVMPLAQGRDRRTQIIWGIKDFEHRFRRFPEGMWLPETAVDTETLELLAEQGITFTILAPRQAARIRTIGKQNWKDVAEDQIDPTRAYRCNLPSGRVITIFFYDGPISKAVAFEQLLRRGEDFANRLMAGFDNKRKWPQLLHIATDGETYGHHQKFADMTLAYALDHIHAKGLARLTNYGEYLELCPPKYEVEIVENSSWSCVHGVERWKSNCGCHTGGQRGWNQEWRAPLRETLDWLRDELAPAYEARARKYFKDPWSARDDYINVMLDRSEDVFNSFLGIHGTRILDPEEKAVAVKLLEIQRQVMLMYTSCGWFFNELSGIETVQIIKYAAAAIHLSRGILNDGLEETFLHKMAHAKSNIPAHRDGAHIYEKFVRPSIIDLKKVGAHYAVSSLFEEYPDEAMIYAYTVSKEDYDVFQAGRTRLAIGRICVTSDITREREVMSFAVIHFGDHSFNGSVRTFLEDNQYHEMKQEISRTFETGDFAEIVRLMDKHCGTYSYSLKDLFADEQRKILNIVITSTIEEYEAAYRGMFENSRHLLGFIKDTGMPLFTAFRAAAELTLNIDLKRIFTDDTIDVDRAQSIADDIRQLGVPLASEEMEFTARHRVEQMLKELEEDPSAFTLLQEIREVIELLKPLPLEINYWQMQNIYYRMAKTAYMDFLLRARSGDKLAQNWIEAVKRLGQSLFFNIDIMLPKD